VSRIFDLLLWQCALIKTITVTGANRGIGLGIAESCLVNGAAKVYSIDLATPDDEFRAVAKRFNGRLFAVQANVTKEQTVAQAIEQIVAEAGALHGMVVNAGRTNHKSALDFTQEEIEALFSVNVHFTIPPTVANVRLILSLIKLFGAFYCARSAARQFIKQNVRGSIVFTASMASYRPNKVFLLSPFSPPLISLVFMPDSPLPSASPPHHMEPQRPAFET